MIFVSPDGYTVQTAEGKYPVLEAIKGTVPPVYPKLAFACICIYHYCHSVRQAGITLMVETLTLNEKSEQQHPFKYLNTFLPLNSQN